MAQSGHIWGHRWLAMTVGVTASLAWFSVCNVLPIPEHRKAPTSQVLPEEEAVAASVTRPEGVGTSTYPSPSVQTAASPRPLRRPPGTPVLLESVISLKMNSRKWAGDSHRESRLPGWTCEAWGTGDRGLRDWAGPPCPDRTASPPCVPCNMRASSQTRHGPGAAPQGPAQETGPTGLKGQCFRKELPGHHECAPGPGQGARRGRCLGRDAWRLAGSVRNVGVGWGPGGQPAQEAGSAGAISRSSQARFKLWTQERLPAADS